MTEDQPTGWTRCRLRDLFRERKERGIPGLPIASVSIESGLVLRSTLDRRVVSSLEHEEHALVRKCDITYNMMRMWQGACGLAHSDCVVSPAYVVMTPLPMVSPDFALEMLRSPAVVKLLHAYSQGIVDDRLRLYPDAFGQIPVKLPPLDEQLRIVEVLHSIDEAIASNLVTLHQVERFRKAVLFAAFEEAAWEPVALGELGKWRSGGTPSKSEAANWHGTIPWICPRDMKVPIISRSTTTITDHALAGSLKTVQPGTLLLVVRGMILARAIPTAITAVEASFNQDIKAFIPNGRASSRFVQLCIQHQEERLLRAVNTATHGTKKLDSDTIESIAVPLPDRTEQDALVEMVSRLDEATVHYGAEHIRLNQVKSGLIADLLSGRVRVPA